jgi:hypothetical protein
MQFLQVELLRDATAGTGAALKKPILETRQLKQLGALAVMPGLVGNQRTTARLVAVNEPARSTAK